MTSSHLLIRHAVGVMTGQRGAAERSAARDLRISDGVITEMGSALAPRPGERVLDASGCVVYPGWVNTHHHLFQSLLKAAPAGIDRTLGPWLQAVPYRHRGAFDERRLRLAVRIGLIELALSGCSTVADHHYLYHPDLAYDPSALLFEEAERLGLRFMLLRGGATVTRALMADDPSQLEPETLDGMIGDVERTVSRFHQRGPRARRRVAFAPTTANVSLRREELTLVARAARAMGIPLHTHMSESVATIEHCREVFGCLPIEFLAEHEWLGPDVSLAHAVHLNDSEMQMLGSTGTGVAHCPQSNARLADGIAAAPRLDRLGAQVSIGVDGAASNEAADMISEVHFCWLVHRALAGARSRARPDGEGEAGADATTVGQVVHWASAGGARMLGFDGVGTIEIGQAADLSVYDLDAPRYFGLHDPLVGPVTCAGRASLKWLLVDGRVVVEDNALPGIDLAELRQQARAEVARLLA